MSAVKVETFERLQEIYEEMAKLLQEARKLMESCGNTHYYERARGYWLGHMASALGDVEGAGLSMCSMKDTLNQLEGNLVEEDEDEDVFDEDDDDSDDDDDDDDDDDK